MATDKKNRKKGLTPEKILAYVESRAGKSCRKVGKELGVHAATAARWTGEVDDYVKSSPEYKNAVEKLVTLIPDAVDAYERNVNSMPEQGSADLAAARDILKIVGLFVEKKAHEHKGIGGSDADLWVELAQLVTAEGESDEPKPDTD